MNAVPHFVVMREQLPMQSEWLDPGTSVVTHHSAVVKTTNSLWQATICAVMTVLALMLLH